MRHRIYLAWHKDYEEYRLTQKTMQRILDARYYKIGKNNVIMTGTVQKKLPFLVFQKENSETLYICSRFQMMDRGVYRCAAIYTKKLCSDAEALRDLDVSCIESAAISAWKAGREHRP